MEDLFNIIVGAFALFYLVSSAKKKRRQQAGSGEEEPGQRPVAPFGPFGPFEPFGPQPQEAPDEVLPPHRPHPIRQAVQRVRTTVPAADPAGSAEEFRKPAGRRATPYGDVSKPFGEEAPGPFGETPAPFGKVVRPFSEDLTPFGDRVASTPDSVVSGRKPARKQERHAAAKPIEKASLQPADTGGQTAQPAAEERHEAIRSFDPERAVIYAEILQPKFKEYE